MEGPSPYEPPSARVNVPPENRRLRGKATRAVGATFLLLVGSVFGCVAGALTGFFGGLTLFDDAGDFTVIFVWPCMLLCAFLGSVFGALVVALFGLLTANGWSRG